MATIGLEEATILAWRKAPGEEVSEGETLFEMETDKVVLEVPSPGAGVLLRVDVPQGPARVGQTVGWVGSPGEVAGEAAVPVAAPEAAVSRPGAGMPARSGVPSASPAARRRARELGIDLSGLPGSGPNGRITERDVEKAAQSRG